MVLQRRPCGPRVVEAIRAQAAELDFAPSFQWGHPKAFELASQLAHLFPGDLDHAFFTNSGSESVDTALKIALAYQRAIGQGTRTRLIGRERGYHGVGFGGISVGGMVKNRMSSAPCWPASTICRTRSTWSATASAAACRHTAPSSPTRWSGWWRCTTPRPSPR